MVLFAFPVLEWLPPPTDGLSQLSDAVLSVVRGYLPLVDKDPLLNTATRFTSLTRMSSLTARPPTTGGLEYLRDAIRDPDPSASRISVLFALVSPHADYANLVLANPPIREMMSRKDRLTALFRAVRTGNTPAVERLLTFVLTPYLADFPPAHIIDTLLLSAGLNRQPAVVESLAAHPRAQPPFALYPVVATARELAAGNEEFVPFSGIGNAAGRTLFDSAFACQAWDVAEFLVKNVPKADLALDNFSASMHAFLAAIQGGLSFAYLLVSQITTPYAELSGDSQENLNRVLYLAIKKGDLEYTLQFLERFPVDLYRHMYAAVQYGQPEILRRLIDRGGDRILSVGAFGFNRGRFLIQQAALFGQIEIVRFLLAKQEHHFEDYLVLGRVADDVYSPICMAIECGQLEILRRLIDRGGVRIFERVGHGLDRGQFLIRQAAQHGHLDVLEFLLARQGHRVQDYATAIKYAATEELRTQVQRSRLLSELRAAILHRMG